MQALPSRVFSTPSRKALDHIKGLPVAHHSLSEESIARKRAWMGGGEPDKAWFEARQLPAYIENGNILSSGGSTAAHPTPQPAGASVPEIDDIGSAALSIAADESGLAHRPASKRQRIDVHLETLKGLFMNLDGGAHTESMLMEHIYQFSRLPKGSAGKPRLKAFWERGSSRNEAPPQLAPPPPRPENLQLLQQNEVNGGPADVPPCASTQYLCSAKEASLSSTGGALAAFLVGCKCDASLPGCPKKTWVHESVLRKQGNGEHLQRAATASCAGSQHYVEGSVCAKCRQQQEGLPPHDVAVGQLQGAVQDSDMSGPKCSSVGGTVGDSMSGSTQQYSLLCSPICSPTQAQALVAGAQVLHVEPPPASCRVPEHTMLLRLRGVIETRTGIGMEALLPLPHGDERGAGASIASRGGMVGTTSGDPSSEELGHFVGCLEFIVATLSACKALVDGGPGGGGCGRVYSMLSSAARCLVGQEELSDVILEEVANYVDYTAGEQPGRPTTAVATRRLGGALRSLAKAKALQSNELRRRRGGGLCQPHSPKASEEGLV